MFSTSLPPRAKAPSPNDLSARAAAQTRDLAEALARNPSALVLSELDDDAVVTLARLIGCDTGIPFPVITRAVRVLQWAREHGTARLDGRPLPPAPECRAALNGASR